MTVRYDADQVREIILGVLDACEYPQAALRVWSVLQAKAGAGQTVAYWRDELAQEAGVAASTVSHALAELEKMGALARKQVPHPYRGRGPITVEMRRFWKR